MNFSKFKSTQKGSGDMSHLIESDHEKYSIQVNKPLDPKPVEEKQPETSRPKISKPEDKKDFLKSISLHMIGHKRSVSVPETRTHKLK